MASRKRDTRFRPEPRRKTTLLTRLLTRQPKGVRLRARRHASAVPIRSLELSFRGAALRRARNPVTYVSDYWIPGSRPFGPRPGMTTRSDSCNASHSGGSPSRRARALSRRENRRTAQLSIASPREIGLPNEAFDRQAGVGRVGGKRWRERPQKRDVAPTSMVLSVEPPVGSML